METSLEKTYGTSATNIFVAGNRIYKFLLSFTKPCEAKVGDASDWLFWEIVNIDTGLASAS